jgi:hypothetical protein
MDWVGFEQSTFDAELMELENGEHADWLRSWVQLPPGPLFSARELRHYFELDINNCWTIPVAMH